MILTSPPANTNAAPAAIKLIEALQRTHPAAPGLRAIPAPSRANAPPSSCRKYSGGVARRATGAEPPTPPAAGDHTGAGAPARGTDAIPTQYRRDTDVPSGPLTSCKGGRA